MRRLLNSFVFTFWAHCRRIGPASSQQAVSGWTSHSGKHARGDAIEIAASRRIVDTGPLRGATSLFSMSRSFSSRRAKVKTQPRPKCDGSLSRGSATGCGSRANTRQSCLKRASGYTIHEMSRTRVVLIGAGFIADIHAESYHRFVPDAELVGVYSRSEERARASHGSTGLGVGSPISRRRSPRPTATSRTSVYRTTCTRASRSRPPQPASTSSSKSRCASPSRRPTR